MMKSSWAGYEADVEVGCPHVTRLRGRLMTPSPGLSDWSTATRCPRVPVKPERPGKPDWYSLALAPLRHYNLSLHKLLPAARGAVMAGDILHATFFYLVATHISLCTILQESQSSSSGKLHQQLLFEHHNSICLRPPSRFSTMEPLFSVKSRAASPSQLLPTTHFTLADSPTALKAHHLPFAEAQHMVRPSN